MATVGTGRHPAVLRRDDTGLIVVDVQEAFRPVIDAFDETVRNCGILAAGFGALGRPVLVSEQYTKGLGRTVPELAERLPEGTEPVEKLRFSACGVEAFDRQLADAGCTWVLCGHSERRELFGESDETVNLKVKAILKHGMTPIMCCGETLEEREAGETEAKALGQVAAGLAGLRAEQVAGLVIAYEPIWAIGTGRTATADHTDCRQNTCVDANRGERVGPGNSRRDVCGTERAVRSNRLSSVDRRERLDGGRAGSLRCRESSRNGKLSAL